MGAWSDSSGYPAVVSFHEGRLVFARTKREPQTMWMSVVEGYNQFIPTERDGLVTDDLAVTITLSSREVNAIEWIEAQKIMIVGTSGGEWLIEPASGSSEPITPSNVKASQQSQIGSYRGGSVSLVTGNSLVFIHREGNKLLEMSYNFELEAWQPMDISAHADDLFDGTSGAIQKIILQKGKDNIVWIKNADGGLIGMTYERDPAVVAFWRVYPATQSTDAFWENYDMTAVSIPSENKNDLYMAAFCPEIQKYGILRLTDGNHLDYNVTATPSGGVVTGVNALYTDGSTVTIQQTDTQHLVWNDTISDIDLTGLGAVDITYGLPFDSEVRVPPMEGGSYYGTSIGKVKRTPKLNIGLVGELLEAYMPAFGFYEFTNTPDDTTDSDEFVYESVIYSNLASGFFTDEIWLKSDYGASTQFGMKSIRARPLTVVYIAPQQHVNE